MTPRVNAWRGFVWIGLALLVALLVIQRSAIAEDRPSAIPDVSPIVAADRRGTEGEPIVITKPLYDRRREEIAETDHARNELWMTLATVGLAILTFLLWGANIWLIVESKRVSRQGASDTRLAINEAKRSADAMHDVAEATKKNAELLSGMLSKQMRAYISVEIGTAVYQNDNLRFEVIPVVGNTGLTPARNVCFGVMADVFDGTKDGFTIPTVDDLIENDVGLSPRQTFSIRAVVPNRFSDVEADTIMEGNSRRLFAWGRVTYDDVFGGSWETNFCINYTFPKMLNGEVRVNGWWYSQHNNAT